MPPPPFRLCLLLTRALCRLDPLQVVEQAVRGGVDCVQLREKEMSRAERYAWGEELLQRCRRLEVPLIINDDLDVALALEAHGVHLGQDDLPPQAVRELLPSDRWIGWSTHNLQQLDDAADLGVDYAGYGPVYATATKGYASGLGVDALWQAAVLARVPLVAIGGIRPQNVGTFPPGIGVAVSSALCAAEDPAAVAAAFRERLTPSAGG